METPDFNDWLDAHYALFPGVASWLGKMQPPDKQAIVRAWAQVLAQTPLDVAKEASQSLYEQETTPTYERHASAVKRIAAGILTARQRTVTAARFGPDTFACVHCRDTGRVEIYVTGNRLRHLIRQLGVSRAQIAARRVGLARCQCQAGAKIEAPAVDYDPNRHVRPEGSWRWFREHRPDDFDRRMFEVEQAVDEISNGITVDHDHEFSGMAPATADMEF